MKYTVIRRAESGMEVLIEQGLSERRAYVIARRATREYPDNQVYVTWFRPTDLQHGYLNADLSHSPVGQPW